MKNIQTNLLSAFESSGLTYDELAKRTNLPKSALYRYINGDTEKIPIDRFQLICDELHVDAGTLLGWKEEPPEPVHVSSRSITSRLISGGVERMPEEKQKEVLKVLQTIYTDYFKEDNNDDPEL